MSIPLLIQASGNEVTGPTVRIPSGDWAFSIEGKYGRLYLSINGESPNLCPAFLTISTFSNVCVRGEKLECVTVKLKERNGT